MSARVILIRSSLLAGVLLVLAGCGAIPPAGEQGAVPNANVTTSGGATASPPQGSPAVVALLSSADAREQAGSYDQAAATLERALRLEPRNAMLWHRLARLRLKQGLWRNAADMAAKSNALAGGDAELQSWNWAVIAEAKERLGDSLGAQEARARVDATKPK